MTIKKKGKAVNLKFHLGDDPLLEVACDGAWIGNLNRNTFKCDMRVEGLVFTVICPMTMVSYFGENGPVPVTADSLEMLATKQFFEDLGKSPEEVDD